MSLSVFKEGSCLCPLFTFPTKRELRERHSLMGASGYFSVANTPRTVSIANVVLGIFSLLGIMNESTTGRYALGVSLGGVLVCAANGMLVARNRFPIGGRTRPLTASMASLLATVMVAMPTVFLGELGRLGAFSSTFLGCALIVSGLVTALIFSLCSCLATRLTTERVKEQ